MTSVKHGYSVQENDFFQREVNSNNLGGLSSLQSKQLVVDYRNSFPTLREIRTSAAIVTKYYDIRRKEMMKGVEPVSKKKWARTEKFLANKKVKPIDRLETSAVKATCFDNILIDLIDAVEAVKLENVALKEENRIMKAREDKCKEIEELFNKLKATKGA